MGKGIIYSEEARDKILSGVQKLSRTVAVTMGPQGRNVILGKFVGAPTITKDGVSVAREIVLDDPFEELGCQLVKEVAGRTADVAGDGTTTAAVLANAILSQGKSVVDDNNHSPLNFRVGINWALEQMLSKIDEMAQPVDSPETLESIAVISVNNDKKLGGVIAEAYNMVGQSGMVIAEAMPGVDDFARLVDGIEIKNGFISPGFLEKGQSKCVLNNCHILICDREITHITDNAKLFHDISNQNKTLLILCKDLKKEALKIFLENNAIGRIRACAVKIPTFGKNNEAWLEDLAILTGTMIVSEERGKPLAEVSVDELGFAKSVEVGRFLTKITGPRKDEARLNERVEIYKNDLSTLIGDLVRKDITDRMAFLSSNAAIVTVGYSTELELREKGDRVDDAMSAVKAAVEEGFVPGGGFALYRAANSIDLKELEEEYRKGAEVLINACRVPAEQILSNAQEESDVILKKVMKEDALSFGYNCATRQYGDLIKMGVIDPKKVTRTALENATSIALLLLTTEAVVAEMPDNPTGWQPPAGWRKPDPTGLNHKY
jgi:chaperonin GroEL